MTKRRLLFFIFCFFVSISLSCASSSSFDDDDWGDDDFPEVTSQNLEPTLGVTLFFNMDAHLLERGTRFLIDVKNLETGKRSRFFGMPSVDRTQRQGRVLSPVFWSLPEGEYELLRSLLVLPPQKTQQGKPASPEFLDVGLTSVVTRFEMKKGVFLHLGELNLTYGETQRKESFGQEFRAELVPALPDTVVWQRFLSTRRNFEGMYVRFLHGRGFAIQNFSWELANARTKAQGAEGPQLPKLPHGTTIEQRYSELLTTAARDCYSTRGVKGKVELAMLFIVSSAGTVTDAFVDDAYVVDEAAEHCVISAVASFVFPPRPQQAFTQRRYRLSFEIPN